MAGRHRRKVSNSTVATIDTSRTKWLKETDILKPLPLEQRGEADSEDWPCFVLTDATVYLKDGKRLANPLLPNQPWVVRGKLEVDVKEHRQYLVDPSIASEYIEIQNSTMYSISYGPLAVWVSGECGWFEIVSPSLKFAETYSQMREAVTLYYEIYQVFEDLEADLEGYYATPERERKRMQKPIVTLDEMLLKYAVAVGDGMLRDEAEERCHKWAPFLINHFPKDRTMKWKRTFFYSWIIDKHPDVYKQYLKRAADEAKRLKAASSKAAPALQNAEPPSRASSVRSQGRSSRTRKQSLDTDVDMKDISPVASPAPPRLPSTKVSKSPVGAAPSPPAHVARATPQPTQHASPAPANQSGPAPGMFSPIDVLIEALEETAAYKGGAAKVARSTAGSRLYYGHRISNYNASYEILAYYSKELVQRLDPKWHASPFWDWLLNESKKPSIELLHTDVEKIPSQLVRRTKKQTNTSTPTAPSTDLPPKLEIRYKVRLPSDDDLDSDADEPSSRPRHAGKGGLRLQSASKKRTAADMLDNESTSSGRRGRKSAKTSYYIPHPDDDEESDAASDSDTSEPDAAPEDEAGNDYLETDPDGLLTAPPKDAVRVIVHAEKLQPSLSPSGPNGTWVCDQEGCGYVVRAAEEAAGRSLVQQHFRDHEARTQRAALAVTEAERRGRMPINHLLEKIQKMGKDSLLKEREVINGEEVPLPIKRRLIV